MVRTRNLQRRGPLGRAAIYEVEEATRRSVAVLAHTHKDNVSFVGDASTAWNLIAQGLEWRDGDNVVINDMEHPAVVMPWLKMSRRGLQVRVVRRTPDWEIDPEDIRRACDSRTRAVVVSHVSYMGGFRHDLGTVCEVAREAAAAFFVDYSHSLGVMPSDFSSCDIGVSASYKWTLGPYGTGIVLWNRKRYPQFEPGSVGWRSLSNLYTPDRFEQINLRADARRFQLGAPGFSAVAGVGAGVDHLLDLGIERVAQHAIELSGQCVDALREIGLEVITPIDPAKRAGNVAFLHPHGAKIAERLSERGIHVWGGDGRVRASFHVLNSSDDVSAFVAALKVILNQERGN